MSLTSRIEAAVQPIQGLLYLVVESQEQVATIGLVDNLDEQAALEALLEDSKPPRPPAAAKLHYLLATPFRYPPLRHGSRFGRSHEPSLLYGGSNIAVTLAEIAYYRCLFLADIKVPFADGLTTQHLLFSAKYRCARGVQLQTDSWGDLHSELTSPVDYSRTQSLGSEMRENSVEAFEFLSARGLQAELSELPYTAEQGYTGINVALFVPQALAKPKPHSQQNMIVTTSPEKVQLLLESHDGRHQPFSFDSACFLVEGVLPTPAGS
ncbi:RES family NAD+ phosphorylase [Allohahella marinimesophila]|uniref:RES family NAD+ phosphorylase n=1 Tax=Allohahella marinimesophila TaxID=1054972 RepID=A0ABP7PRS4_9GAMM